jgi:hypothetical protein
MESLYPTISMQWPAGLPLFFDIKTSPFPLRYSPPNL